MVFVTRPAVISTTPPDIPQLADLKRSADDKYNAEKWYTASMGEMWSWPGIESITGVGGDELIEQAGLGETVEGRRSELLIHLRNTTGVHTFHTILHVPFISFAPLSPLIPFIPFHILLCPFVFLTFPLINHLKSGAGEELLTRPRRRDPRTR